MKDSGKFVTTKSITALIGGLYLATSFAAVLSVLFLLTSLDRASRADRATRVDIALKLETRYMQGLLLENSYWDEAYEKMVVSQDEVWIAENTGQFLIDEYDFDFSLAIQANQQLAHMSVSNAVEGLRFEQLMAGGLAELIEASFQDEINEGAVAGYVLAGADVYLVALGPFRDEETEKVRPGSYLSLGRRLDDEYLGFIVSTYELPELSLVKNTAETVNSRALLTPSRQTIGQLAWPLERPSLDLAPKVICLVMPFFCLNLLLTQYLLRRNHADRTALEERLYKEATLDAVTHISNRRHFMALGQQEVAFHQRNGGGLAVALFDIDHFKLVNDTYGHAMGDRALVHVTQLCSSELRASDILGRIGGDEFAIILRKTTIEEATKVVDRIRKKIETCPLAAHNRVIAMTVSIGLAQMQDNITFDSILQVADVALYKAKHSGRNQVFAIVDQSYPN
jgi:two-component system cell cycle response regulator